MLSFLRNATRLALILVFSFSTLPASAQQTESRIVGRILDQSGAALPGATIAIVSRDTGAVRTDVAGGDGAFTVTNLGPGAYDIRAELDGFQRRPEPWSSASARSSASRCRLASPP